MCADDKSAYREQGYKPRRPDGPITEQDYEDPLRNWRANPAPARKRKETKEMEG
jgi:hypothetical protein